MFIACIFGPDVTFIQPCTHIPDIQVPERQPGRFGRGTLGKPISLITNWFLIELPDNLPVIYGFDIKIDRIHKDATPVPKAIPGLPPPAELQQELPKEKSKSKRKKKKQQRHKEEASSETTDRSIPDENSEIVKKVGSLLVRKIPKTLRCKIFREFVNSEEHLLEGTYFAFDGGEIGYSTSIPKYLKDGKTRRGLIKFSEFKNGPLQTYEVIVSTGRNIS